MNRPHIKEHDYQNIWEEIERSFNVAGTVNPEPGFSARWRTRIALERQREQRRQAVLIASFYALAALAVLLLILMQLLPALPEPTDLIVLMISWFGRLFAWSKMVFNVAGSIAKVVAGVVPASIWLNIFGAGILAMTWWVIQFRQTAFKRGIK